MSVGVLGLSFEDFIADDDYSGTWFLHRRHDSYRLINWPTGNQKLCHLTFLVMQFWNSDRSRLVKIVNKQKFRCIIVSRNLSINWHFGHKTSQKVMKLTKLSLFHFNKEQSDWYDNFFLSFSMYEKSLCYGRSSKSTAWRAAPWISCCMRHSCIANFQLHAVTCWRVAHRCFQATPTQTFLFESSA